MQTVSVIVSIYNIASYVERCIDSIITQSYGNLEIILVDDGSSDHSGKICDRYAAKDSRIRVIHKENGGLSSARNAGIEQATGELIAFVDGDDWIHQEMICDMVNALEKEDADLVICNYREVTEKEFGLSFAQAENKEYTIFNDKEVLDAFIEEKEEYNIQNAAWNKLYKKTLMGELRFPEGKLFEDIVYTTKLLSRSKRSVYLHESYYYYLVNRKDSIMNSVKAERILTDQVEAYLEKGKFLLTLKEKKWYYTHQYFFLKRMMNHYVHIEQSKAKGYKEHLAQLKRVILTAYDPSAYEGRSKGDKVRISLFKISPQLFLLFTKVNESWILPYKQLKSAQDEELVVIRLSGGMGNQMFQYALYLQLKALGRRVKIEDETEYALDNARPKRLDVFHLTYERPTELEMMNLTDSSLDLVSRIRRKLTGRKTAELAEQGMNFHPEVLETKRAYLTGWWQSERYFAGVKDEVRRAFTFPELLLNDKMEKIRESILCTDTVAAVHIRRGDYLDISEVYGGICTREYYEQAIKEIKKECPDCHFFIFSNDPEWVKKEYTGNEFTVVEGNDEDHGYIDLYLMSLCKKFIIANSSFSWWGSYLSKEENKKIIAPYPWIKGKDAEDIYTENMICINHRGEKVRGKHDRNN